MPAAPRIPSIDRLLLHAQGQALRARYGHQPVVAALREAAAGWRAQTMEAAARGTADLPPDAMPDAADAALATALLDTAARQLDAWHRPSLVRVFNLTGTVLHTNLGRAALAVPALEAITAVAAGACNLEYDLDAGRRGARDHHVQTWLSRLTGAEAAAVVNNNAAAVLLVLHALARRREVIVSRGELVEIGGSFRVPEVMAAAGAVLREVGTTNRVHARDYAEAIGPKTALIMKVHPSNYRIDGFTAGVPEAEIARIAQAAGIPLVNDLGSGTLFDFARFGLPREPTVQEAVAAGADLVTFSGDKLLGGPQTGIIAGRAALVARIAKAPLMRALRVDKLRLAALEATLRCHADEETARATLPTLRWLTRPVAEIAAQAAALAPTLAVLLAGTARVEIVECRSQIGSGALPVEVLPSAGLALTPLGARAGKRAVERLAADLRALPVPVIGRIHQGAVLLDLRCLDDAPGLVAAFARRAAGAAT